MNEQFGDHFTINMRRYLDGANFSKNLKFNERELFFSRPKVKTVAVYVK